MWWLRRTKKGFGPIANESRYGEQNVAPYVNRSSFDVRIAIGALTVLRSVCRLRVPLTSSNIAPFTSKNSLEVRSAVVGASESRTQFWVACRFRDVARGVVVHRQRTGVTAA